MSGNQSSPKGKSPTPEGSPSSKPVNTPPVHTGNTALPARSAIDTFLDGVEGLDNNQVKLLEELYIANGQDAFDAEAAAVGRLKQEEYLALPKDLAVPRIPPSKVGTSTVREFFTAKTLAAIYSMNKARTPTGDDPVVYGMLRMEAVKIGWVNGQKEIVYIPFDKYADALKEFAQDLATVRTRLDLLRLAAFLVPLACEHTFRVTGHHYLTGLAADYQARYRKTFKACLGEEVMTLLQPATLFHHVLHWVSPERSYNVLSAQLTTMTLPDAMVIRSNSAPAGWAIITTTAAVLQAMASANIGEKVEEEFEGDLEEVSRAAISIKNDVRRWHKAYYAYGVAPPSQEQQRAMEDVRETAIAFAPYAQGFIEGTLKDAALGQAQALKKHAELNPVARQRAARFFRRLARTEVSEISDLFRTSLKDARAEDDD
jgi:hypothetical protein